MSSSRSQRTPSTGRGYSSGSGISSNPHHTPRQQHQPHHPPRGTPHGGRGPQQQQQPQPSPVHRNTGIPHGHIPAYLPGSASLVEELDQAVMVVLRDGKHIVGTLVSYDQFSNLILHDAVERRIVLTGDCAYCSDVPLGLYVVRGDSMVLLGKVNESVTMNNVSLEELESLMKKADEPLEWDFDNDLIA